MNDRELFDHEALLSHVGGDRQFFRELLSEALVIIPSHVSDIDSAITAQNADALKRAAHRLKGGMRSIQAMALAKIAEKIEAAAPGANPDVIIPLRNELLSVTDQTLEEIRKNIT